jgi:hypothetical protein
MSDEGRAPPERPKRDPLEDTQEMERIRAPGFHNQTALDPWNEVTPQELSGEQPALVIAVEESGDLADDLFLGDGPYAAPMDRPIEDKPMRIADPRSPSALSKFALAGPLNIERSAPGRSGSSIRVGDAAIAISRRVPSTVGRAMVERERPTEIVRAHHEAGPARKYPKMRALLRNPEKVPHGSTPPSKPKPPPVPGTFIPASKREREKPVVDSAPGDLDEMLATMAEGLLIGEDATGHTEVRVTLRDEFFAGTELRITLGEDGVTAILVPPDRMTYMMLNGNVDDLRVRLESRGLRVSKVKVAEPG